MYKDSTAANKVPYSMICCKLSFVYKEHGIFFTQDTHVPQHPMGDIST